MPADDDVFDSPFPLHCSSCGAVEAVKDEVSFRVAAEDEDLVAGADDDEWLLHLEDLTLNDDDIVEDAELYMYCPDCHDEHPVAEQQD